MDSGRCAIEGCPEGAREGTSSCARHAAFETGAPPAWSRVAGLSVGASLAALVAAALVQPRLCVALGLDPSGWPVLRALFAVVAACFGAREALRSLERAASRRARVLSALAILFSALTVFAVGAALLFFGTGAMLVRALFG